MPAAVLVLVGLLQRVIEPDYLLLPLLVLAPALAALIGGAVYALVVGALAVGEVMLISFGEGKRPPAEHLVFVLISVVGITVIGAVVARIRRRRERDLLEVQAVADVTQQVLLRPVPDRMGPLRLAARYLSASARARVGGDLYAVVSTAQGVRLLVGDAEGKGLPAVQEAATAMNAFRAVSHQEATLAGVAARMEVTLTRELGDEQFITAVLAEVSPDGNTMQIINCGHPQPLQLTSGGPELLGPEGGVPFGLGLSAAAERNPLTIPLRAGEPVLFYTDGLTEARNRYGEFFPLTESPSVQASADPSTILDRLSAEVHRYVGHRPHDDLALLVIERTGP